MGTPAQDADVRKGQAEQVLKISRKVLFFFLCQELPETTMLKDSSQVEHDVVLLPWASPVHELDRP